MKFLTLRLFIASLFATIVFTGCTAYEQAVVANTLTGGSAYNDSYYYDGYNYGNNRDTSYRNGVEDGCSSKRGVWRKNIYQYNNNYSYRNGWNAGYNRCRSNYNNYNNNYYSQGYSDGCWSRRNPGTRQNTYQYNRNQSYRNGWNNGYSACRY